MREEKSVLLAPAIFSLEKLILTLKSFIIKNLQNKVKTLKVLKNVVLNKFFFYNKLIVG